MKEETNILKAARRISREQEIKQYNKPICWFKIEKNKKAYTRKLKHKNDYGKH